MFAFLHLYLLGLSIIRWQFGDPLFSEEHLGIAVFLSFGNDLREIKDCETSILNKLYTIDSECREEYFHIPMSVPLVFSAAKAKVQNTGSSCSSDPSLKSFRALVSV